MSKARHHRPDSVPDLSADQTASDEDQTSADADQTSSDRDQTLADRDQLASERDQDDADDDQDASDHDLEAGGDAVAHRHSRLTRQRTRSSRSKTSELRDQGGLDRLDSADNRDRAAELRDQGAASRDARARAATDRRRAADDRARSRHLRVLVADEGRDRHQNLGDVVAGLGHEVVARVVEVSKVGSTTTREHPDVALVWLGASSDHALELIDEIVREASCPVIALLTVRDSAYVREAAKHGIFAYIVDTGPEELQSAIDITLQRFTEYHDLQGAFGRRAVIEQAKGMLMARHGVDDETAFELLRKHSQHGGSRLSDVAAAIVDTNSLLRPEGGADRSTAREGQSAP